MLWYLVQHKNNLEYSNTASNKAWELSVKYLLSECALLRLRWFIKLDLLYWQKAEVFIFLKQIQSKFVLNIPIIQEDTFNAKELSKIASNHIFIILGHVVWIIQCHIHKLKLPFLFGQWVCIPLTAACLCIVFLSVQDGVMVLSATHRYKKKYVTSLLYKPI